MTLLPPETRLAKALSLGPAESRALVRELTFLEPEERTRLAEVVEALGRGEPSRRPQFLYTALDVLALAGPEAREVLLQELPGPARLSLDLAQAFLRGAVDFLGPQADPALIAAWAEVGLGLARAGEAAGREFFLQAPPRLKRLSASDLRQGLVRLFEHCLAAQAAESVAALEKLVEGLRGVRPADKAPALLALLERIAPVSWPGALAFLTRIEVLVRHLGWEGLEAWVEEGLRLAAGAGLAAEERARLYFSLSSAESETALDTIGPGPALSHLERYLGWYALLVAGREVKIRPLAALSAEQKRDLAGRAAGDGRSIFLPERLPFLAEPEERDRFYKVLTAREAGRVRSGTFTLDLERIAGQLEKFGCRPPILEDMPVLERFWRGFPNWPLARDLFELLETARVESALRRDFPGLAPDLDRFGPELDPAVVDPGRPVAAVLGLTRRLIRGKKPPPTLPVPLRRAAAELAGLAREHLLRPGAAVEDTALLTAQVYPRLDAGRPGPQETSLVWLRSEEALKPEPGEALLSDEPEDLRREINSGYFPLTKFGLRHEVEGNLHDLLARTRTAPRTRGTDTGRPYTYDEWDHRLGGYRRAWVTLREVRPRAGPSDFVDRTRARHARLAARIRRQFELLRPAGLVRRRRWLDGEELDFDRVIEALAERRAGSVPSEKIYTRQFRQAREVALAVLVDLSGSTARPVTREKRVIDLEKEALVLLAEALEAVGDTWAFFGFSGAGREGVTFSVLKDFDQPFDLAAQSRLGACEPGDQNRDGAALRHAAARLALARRRQNLLVFLSDGQPDDYDYPAAYSQEDTRMALREIKRQGLHPFSVTVGDRPHDHLARMYSEVKYTVVSRIESLPEKLSAIYRRLTT